uniref:Uncharacterized protein n=1 Tax=Chromera velia CCMP2878 TaxID=1169474 RepID=A0A0G4F0F3_9ALVE|eukprot:Cvel_2610.t1-p1 / transcript=Cvel_2610.t1 / gene=Cvel_2610 / organism=Chromera_velia_CCMP2878 / gene_product=hypothetical protein / transcript_product=hypothetical protein / location=Cvel_scaffold103:70538-79074(+) / protein_length=955 / sequence_SO=supercontig / SO=protein_coding / is_pseudo=false
MRAHDSPNSLSARDHLSNVMTCDNISHNSRKENQLWENAETHHENRADSFVLAAESGSESFRTQLCKEPPCIRLDVLHVSCSCEFSAPMYNYSFSNMAVWPSQQPAAAVTQHAWPPGVPLGREAGTVAEASEGARPARVVMQAADPHLLLQKKKEARGGNEGSPAFQSNIQQTQVRLSTARTASFHPCATVAAPGTVPPGPTGPSAPFPVSLNVSRHTLGGPQDPASSQIHRVQRQYHQQPPNQNNPPHAKAFHFQLRQASPRSGLVAPRGPHPGTAGAFPGSGPFAAPSYPQAHTQTYANLSASSGNFVNPPQTAPVDASVAAAMYKRSSRERERIRLVQVPTAPSAQWNAGALAENSDEDPEGEKEEGVVVPFRTVGGVDVPSRVLGVLRESMGYQQTQQQGGGVPPVRVDARDTGDILETSLEQEEEGEGGTEGGAKGERDEGPRGVGGGLCPSLGVAQLLGSLGSARGMGGVGSPLLTQVDDLLSESPLVISAAERKGGGLTVLDGLLALAPSGEIGVWTGFRWRAKSPNKWRLEKIAVDVNGDLWCLSSDHKMGRLVQSGWKNHGILGGAELRDFDFDKNNRLTGVNLQGEVVIWNGYSWDRLGALGSWKLEQLTFDPSGVLWGLSTSGNVGSFDRRRKRWKDFGQLGGWRLKALTFDNNGRLWAVGPHEELAQWADEAKEWVIYGYVGNWHFKDIAFRRDAGLDRLVTARGALASGILAPVPETPHEAGPNSNIHDLGARLTGGGGESARMLSRRRLLSLSGEASPIEPLSQPLSPSGGSASRLAASLQQPQPPRGVLNANAVSPRGVSRGLRASSATARYMNDFSAPTSSSLKTRPHGPVSIQAAAAAAAAGTGGGGRLGKTKGGSGTSSHSRIPSLRLSCTKSGGKHTKRPSGGGRQQGERLSKGPGKGAKGGAQSSSAQQQQQKPPEPSDPPVGVGGQGDELEDSS